jgi:hypothetical protein
MPLPSKRVQSRQFDGVAQHVITTNKIALRLKSARDAMIELRIHIYPLRMADRKYQYHTVARAAVFF